MEKRAKNAGGNPAWDVIEEVKKAVIGKDQCISRAMTAILAGGHILLEDIPGVGKTTLAVALSRAMELKQNRVQFTPDVLPADIVGFSMYQKETGKFVYQPGAVMCNLLLAGDGGRCDAQDGGAVYRDRDSESHRQRRNTAFAGIPDGPLHDLYDHGISGYSG